MKGQHHPPMRAETNCKVKDGNDIGKIRSEMVNGMVYLL